MDHFSYYTKKIQNLCTNSWKLTKLLLFRTYHIIVMKSNPFFMSIFYLLFISIIGFVMLKAWKPRAPSPMPRNIDLLFTSVSAATVSSMATVEMEVFSAQHLIVMTVLMFLGGEIFTSLLRLHFTAKPYIEGRVEHVESLPFSQHMSQTEDSFLKLDDAIKFLAVLVLGYVAVVQTIGVASVLMYLSLVSGAEGVLKNKGIKTSIFSVFTVVSTFANCGFIPMNENLILFSKNTGLLLILLPQILLGNTLFPSALRVIICVLGKKFKRTEAEYLLKNTKEVGFPHLLPRLESTLLATTVMGFLLIASVLFSSMEWHNAGLDGMNSYRRVVGIFFQCANARHSGENIVDLSTIAPAILVFFMLMMYLPPYTSFVPTKSEEQGQPKLEGKKKRKYTIAKNFTFSQISYLAIFIVLICITERKSLKDDPINFSVLNIAFEVISAYGNVGLTTGYSCNRQVRRDPKCVDKWYGLAGKWSDEGKLILIVVMLFGRLKKFNVKGGRAWKLL
ncbi:putative cation transporter HKT6 [Salvia divinorum]|uniref:Cation transporter HKT6 n=1 Tax=Salvia divinorum TaxID=28513 RepID=A0ABD1G7M5_SALDI